MPEWVDIGPDEPATAGDYLAEIELPLIDDLPEALPDWFTGPAAAMFSTFGLWDARFRGDGNRLFVSYRIL